MADTTYNHPLRDEHCACLDKVIAQTATAIQLARDCKDCGLPTDDYIEQLQAQGELARKMKAKFFPTRV